MQADALLAQSTKMPYLFIDDAWVTGFLVMTTIVMAMMTNSHHGQWTWWKYAISNGHCGLVSHVQMLAPSIGLTVTANIDTFQW